MVRMPCDGMVTQLHLWPDGGVEMNSSKQQMDGWKENISSKVMRGLL